MIANGYSSIRRHERQVIRILTGIGSVINAATLAQKGHCSVFKGLAKNADLSYQNLINLYLRDCVETKKEPRIQWSHPT